VATAENQTPTLRVEPRASLKDQWAERARARNLVSPVDLSAFPGEPPLWMRKLRGSEIHLWQNELGTDGEVDSHRNARIIALCASDESGAAVLTADDALALPVDLFAHLLRAALDTLGYRQKAEEQEPGKEAPSGG
jgi:hypothetical protein